MKKEWLAPLTGVLFLIVVIIGFAVGGEPEDADSPLREIVNFYVDNKDSVQISAVLIGLAFAVFIYFAAYLRKVHSQAAGPGNVISAVVLVGAALMAVGATIDATLAFAMAEAADDLRPGGHIPPETIQTMQAIWDNDFLPIAVGMLLFLSANGLAVVLNGGLPKWLGWVAIVLAIFGLTPLWFVPFIGGALWILVVSILLAVRLRRQPAAGAA